MMSPKKVKTQQEISTRSEKTSGHSKSTSEHSVQYQNADVKGSEEFAMSWKRSSLYMPQRIVVSNLCSRMTEIADKAKKQGDWVKKSHGLRDEHKHRIDNAVEYHQLQRGHWSGYGGLDVDCLEDITVAPSRIGHCLSDQDRYGPMSGNVQRQIARGFAIFMSSVDDKRYQELNLRSNMAHLAWNCEASLMTSRHCEHQTEDFATASSVSVAGKLSLNSCI